MSLWIFFLNVLIFLPLGSQPQNSLSFSGKSLFMDNCSVCHRNGQNIILPEKNLQLKTLKLNGMNTSKSIVYQIVNGKNGMPAFGGRLNEKDIEKITEYILRESDSIF
jgi:cytochrome c6